MKRALWLFEAGLYFIFSIPLAFLPLGISAKAGEILGLLLFYIWGSRRKIAIENIQNSKFNFQFSEARDVIKENFRNLGRSLSEVIKIYYGLGEKIIHSVEVEGIENIERAKSRGRGVLFITGHCGNWELLGTAMSVKVTPSSIVARPINNPYINDHVERVRQKHGNNIIYKKGALKNMLKILKENGCVGILMDQSVLPDEGFVMDFLGRRAWVTKMPALIARKTGAAVLPLFIHRTGNRHKMIIYPEVELSHSDDKEQAVMEDTKRFSGFIENYIKEHPSEWLWIHRRWKRVI